MRTTYALDCPYPVSFTQDQRAHATFFPFTKQALEPSISAQIMELHHSRHHRAYVDNLNRALSSQAAAVASDDIAEQIALQGAIRFHGGGHMNHCLFWENLAPASSPEAADPHRVAPSLMAAITRTWGGLDEFKGAFAKTLLALQGSGWGWLVRDGPSLLRIVTTKDQDPVVGGEVPIIGVDMWEHAYYLQVRVGIALRPGWDLLTRLSISTARLLTSTTYGRSSIGRWPSRGSRAAATMRSKH